MLSSVVYFVYKHENMAINNRRRNELGCNLSLYNIGECVCEWRITEDNIIEASTENSLSFDLYLFVEPRFWLKFSELLSNSKIFRKLALEHFYRTVIQNRCVEPICTYVRVGFLHNTKESIDYSWEYRIEKMVYERMTLETVMSYLSTLGGAFSSLGDSMPKCAIIAGQISRKQFDVALRLGEEPLIARCRLYLALSLMQQNNYKVAKEIILRQFVVANELKDKRLQNMCKGLWAKLRYTRRRNIIDKLKI